MWLSTKYRYNIIGEIELRSKLFYLLINIEVEKKLIVEDIVESEKHLFFNEERDYFITHQDLEKVVYIIK
jgi:hypothetical protein